MNDRNKKLKLEFNLKPEYVNRFSVNLKKIINVDKYMNFKSLTKY